jgi:hypothetical protein
VAHALQHARTMRDPDPDPDPVPLLTTWYQDVGPIVAEKCMGCHHDGGIAPFSLETYESAATYGMQMLAAVEDGEMPPWSDDRNRLRADARVEARPAPVDRSARHAARVDRRRPPRG